MKRLSFLIFLLFVVIADPRLPAQENGFVQDIDLVTMPTGEKLVRWYGKTGHSYFLQASKASAPLAKWAWAPMIESGNDQYISHEVDGTPDKGFFRLLHTTLEQPPGVTLEDWDPDGDRLNNWAEITTHGSNPLKPDTDDDGLPDDWEVAHHLNVLDNGSEDPAQGPNALFSSFSAAAPITNIQAFAAGVQAFTGATLADRDGDLVPDSDDADPLSGAVSWRNSPKPVYAAIPVSGWVPATHLSPILLNNQNDVLTSRAVYKGGQWIPINGYYLPSGPGPALPYQFEINGRLHPCRLAQCAINSISDQGDIMGSGRIFIDSVTAIDPGTGQLVTYTSGYSPTFALIWRTPEALPEIFGVAPGTTFQGARHEQSGMLHRDGTVLMRNKRPQDILVNNDWTLERRPTAANGGGIQASPTFSSPGVTYPAIGGSFAFPSYLSTAQGLVVQSWIWPATGTPKSLYTVTTSASGAPALNFQSSPSTIGTAPGGEACINLSSQVLVGHSGRFHQVPGLQGATKISPHGAALIPGPPGNPSIWYGGSTYSLSSCVSNPQALGSTLTVADINDGGSMLATVDVNTTGQKLVILIPVEVVPDYNRDGMINDDDRGKVTEEKPFVFWTNDDDDQNPEPHFGDIPGTQIDGADMLVNDARDLVDFFPVELRLEQILAVLPTDEYTYKVSHPTGAFHFIEMPDVHPDSSPEAQGAGAYLRNPTMADEAMARPMLDTAGQGAELTAEYLNAAKDGMGVLLFEAKTATNQSFELIISKKAGGVEVGRITRAMPVEIEDVEKMFWRANIRPAAYGQTPGTIIEPTNAKFKASRKERWFVFCHGYNVSEEAAKGWNAEVFKRLHQMGSDSKFLGVTWEGNQGQINPSIPFAGGATPDYWQNVYNAFQSSASLSTLVNGLSGGAKVIAGHSLGNMIVSSAICDKNLNAEKYFMLNAAVPREAYSASHVADRLLVRNPSWSQYDGDTRLWASDYWNLFPNNDGRHKLTWNGRFSTLGANTAAHNYYSSGEEVLKKGNGSKPNLFLDVTIKSQLAWVKQEMSKGELTKKLVTGTHSSNGGWAYNSAWNGNPPADSTLLKATPYFKPFTDFYDANGQNPQSIHGANGSNLAGQYPLRAFLLGHDIPAISNPAGSDLVDGYSGSNMNTQLRNGNWGDWKHSDLKNQDLGHVWKVYSDMVSRGLLNKDLTPPPIN